MNIVDAEKLPSHDDDHPTGALRQRYFFRGSSGSPDNFEFSIAQTTARFQMIRHRHNFDQFRFPLAGDMSMGQERALREGWLGYFPEGAAYGPQDDEAGPVALVLQFGGASGYGYMDIEQYRAGREALKKKGHFEGAVFVRNDGEPGQKKKFSINAIWEESAGRRMLIPTPRYDRPVFINPAAFRWVPYRKTAGVFRKALGTFTEREATAEMWRIDAGASVELKAQESTRLLFVLEGHGTINGEALGRHFAIRIDTDESAKLAAADALTLLAFNLPLVGESWSEPQAPSFEPVPGEAVPQAFA